MAWHSCHDDVRVWQPYYGKYCDSVLMLVQVKYDGLVKYLVKSVSLGAVIERKEGDQASSARQSLAFIPT